MALSFPGSEVVPIPYLGILSAWLGPGREVLRLAWPKRPLLESCHEPLFSSEGPNFKLIPESTCFVLPTVAGL